MSLEKENKELKKRIKLLESGSRKSLLNCHEKGKKNFQAYIDLHYPALESPGNFIRRLFDQVEPYSYDDVIRGEF